MQKIKSYIKLLRPKHYLKNALVLAPLFFDCKIFDYNLRMRALLGFLAFSFMSSVVYIINDVNDIEADRKNDAKKIGRLQQGS